MGSIRTNRKPAAATVNTGDLTVSDTPPTVGTLQTSRIESQDAAITVAAGKRKVDIYNAGTAQLNGVAGAASSISVNSQPVFVGGRAGDSEQYDRANNELLKTPQYVISNPDGATVWISIIE